MRTCRIRAEGTRSHANCARLEKEFLSAAEPKNSSSSETKQKPGTGFRPGAVPEFQFDECTDLRTHVERQPLKANGARHTGDLLAKAE
jgi:hypothetical protein